MGTAATTFRWQSGALDPVDDCELTDVAVLAADSWLVEQGRTLALELHRRRFAASAEADEGELAAFWSAAIAEIPREGAWFPRVESRRVRGRQELQFLLRPAPDRRRGVALVTHDGPDPRRSPSVKGPDLERLLRLRSRAQERGADEAVILSPDREVVEGTTTALAWWRGAALAIPHRDLPRVDSVTLRSVLAIAAATGVEVREERATPLDLDGAEVWALSALHGIRVATSWRDDAVGSVELAEEPGRAQAWRDRLAALRRPLP